MITHSGGKLDAMYEDAQAALWRSPCGEELKPPANSQNQLAGHGGGAILEPDPPGPVRPADNHSPNPKPSS